MRVHSARPHGLGRAAPLPAHATERTETEEAGEGGRWKHTGSDRQEGGRMEGWRDGGRAGRRAGGDVRAPCASSPRSARNRSPPRSAPGRASASPAPSAGPPREMRGSVSRTEPTERRAAPRPACKGLRAERWRLCALRACDRGSAAFELAPAGPTGARKAWAPRRIPGGSDRDAGSAGGDIHNLNKAARQRITASRRRGQRGPAPRA